jgi:hypothetical protein
MGSLTSRPAALSQPQVIYTAPASKPAVSTTSPAATPSSPVKNESAVREEGLLMRDRGRFGTVLTGFRGLLAGSASAPRKTLLGE